MYSLDLDKDSFAKKTVRVGTQEITYRSIEQIPYIENPVDDELQRLNIFAPEEYFVGETTSAGYTAQTAPIFMPNEVGGYMPGHLEVPGRITRGPEAHTGEDKPNTLFQALKHGYVVVSPGVRGNGRVDAEGKNCGMAPASICDLKAAVRFLRHNKTVIPGDTERIISNGTSAGGALSALLGASGDHPDYLPYLDALGAAKTSDAIFASSCYCPITNLDHADMAYEWEFSGLNDYHRMKFIPPKDVQSAPTFEPDEGVMDETRQAMSLQLKAMFPDYLNSLRLKDKAGNALTLDEQGNGTFKDYVMSIVKASAQGQLDEGKDLSEFTWLTSEDGQVKTIDFDAYVRFRTRMKATPAFDDIVNRTPENELFGSVETKYRHFTTFAQQQFGGERADDHQIRLMNAMNYVADPEAKTASHYRLRHGSVDRDTSLAISAMLTLLLQNNGVDADLAYPWGRPHSGDYDLDELFAWIDGLCQ